MKKNQKIMVRSWVHVGGELVEVDSLPPEERKRLAAELKVRWLNDIFAGRVVFSLPDEFGGPHGNEIAACDEILPQVTAM